MGQIFPAGPAAAAAAPASGFYVPTMPRAYYPNNMQQMRPQPRWPSQQQVRGPAQPGGGTASFCIVEIDENNNGAQRYEQFLQVGRLHRALILLGLALCLPSASVSSVFMVLYAE